MHPSPRRGRRVALPTAVLLAAALALPVPAAAQRAGLGIDLLATIDGPPPPDPPAVLARDETGRVTGRAVRLETPLDIDGRLDEEVYATVPAMSDFIQVEPQAGAPATEKTEIWIFFDDENVYFVARCWESEPGRLTVDEMRRDNNNIGRNDNVSWFFDTLYDRRTGLVFEVNPLGGRMDGQSLNEARTNFDWNPIWDLEGGAASSTAGPLNRRCRSSPSATGRGTAQLWGLQRPAPQQVEERAVLPGPDSPPRSGGRGLRAPLAAPARRHRDAANQAQPGVQAVRHRRPDQRYGRLAADFKRARGHGRARHEVRGDPQPDGRLHPEHRFRAGGSRRAAGQPDALQPVSFPRSASSFSRTRARSPSAARRATATAATRRSCSTAGASAWRTGARCRCRPAAAA